MTAARPSTVALLALSGLFTLFANGCSAADAGDPSTVAGSTLRSVHGHKTTPTAGTAVGAGTGATVVVDVTGKVRRPGIATLPAGARVVDLVGDSVFFEVKVAAI